ncbi:integrin alpha-PS2 isoform X2 [Scaptodrosophila lebanonensis]|uniref:Integrin alpha-PS2 isoform X2 n=1 Tax=Drosophila lebanonensis TaxID=7225 RepID=A0A6J2U477_DROLE|nr:integrin alpha-PS2 isoform X2 [Scaptodrosophila lebanonensis]
MSRSTSKMMMLAIALLLCLLQSIQSYNIDLPSYVRHRHAPNSMFGFSIALHKTRNDFSNFNSLVVGAPKFDTSSYQQGVKEAGAVFRCSMNDDECKLVTFDSKGNNRNEKGEIIDRKSYQWLGATVATGRDNDLVVACAPRYVFHSMSPSSALRFDPVGTCFTSHNFQQFHEVSPCRTNNWGYHRQGSCQAGFSAAINSNGSRLYIGAPGSWYWQGQTYSTDVTRPENQVFFTPESSSPNDDSYLGYSMVTGDFNGDHNEDVAIGMPRGANLLGKIVVNRWNMANIFNITGRQIGEYFGYALSTSDVDGDGLDDLIIGAPMYTEPGNVEGKYDVGRVYVLVQRGTTPLEPWTTEYIRDGFNTKGRFGLALTTLGDVNRDGYGDFAVGAPYDGPEGRGVVYIYHGSAQGPLAKPSQIIKAEELVEGAPYPRTFGFSLSGGVDMDGNTYPDLAVGAYAADQVFIFKARPVAAVNAETTFSNPSKLINLEERNCQLQRDHSKVPCMELTTCWSYTGKYLPEELDFDVSWVLDAKKTRNPRMFFLLDEGKNIRNQTIRLAYGRRYCRNETVYLIDNVQDKLTPLEVEARYNLRSRRQFEPVVRRKRDALEPVIDQNREIVLRDAINIQKNCGPDNICEPDLKLEIKTVDKYLFGSPEPLTFDVLISNGNEDAFEAAFYMVMPRELDFKKLQQLGDKNDPPITCTAPSPANNYTLKCDIGNPLQGQKVANFRVILTPAEKFGSSRSYEFFMEANSTNLEKPNSHFDNIIRKSIGIWVDTDLDIRGNSVPDFAPYKASDYKAVENATNENDLGPHVVHIYEIRNNRPSIIEEAVVLIYYPYETIAGDPLMYVLKQPEVGGNIRCDPHSYVNPRNLKLDEALSRKSFLHSDSSSAAADAAAIGGSTVVIGSGAAGSESGGHIEISQSSQAGGTVHVGRGGTRLSPKEKELLEREDAQDVSGDASFVHSFRANQAAAEQETGGASGADGGGWSTWSSSWNSSAGGAAPASVVVSAKNVTTYYDDSGRPHVVESSTEYVHNLERGPAQQYVQHASLGGVRGGSSHGGKAHSTQGHIQMAAPSGQSSGYQQTFTQGANYQPRQYQQQSQQSQQQIQSPAGYSDYAGGQSADKSIHAGRDGFRTGTLDLGTIDRTNVDNELRNRGAGGAGGGGSSSSSYSTQYGSRPGTVHHHETVYSSGSKPYYGRENEDYYDEDNLLQQQQQQQLSNAGGGGQQQWSSSSSQRRFRRADGPTSSSNGEPKQVDLNSPCKAAKCETLRCVVKNLDEKEAAYVAIRTRLVAHTMEKIASNVPLNVSTLAVAHVTLLPFIGRPKDEIKKSFEIFYKAVPEPTPTPDVVPLWVVVLSACAGALIFLLLVLALYKCGFFNRNRPTDHSQERQPLRNGYHGDEHL